MPNRTAARTGFTRLAHTLILATVGSKATRSALLSLVVLSASGCENSSSVAPTPAPSSSPVPVTVTPVRLEGRVLDEHNHPVAGARIALRYTTGGPASTTTDDTGSFGLTVDWPANWPGITLGVDREGYESAEMLVQKDEASNTVLINIYRSLTIRPGESIQTTLSLRAGDCGFEPFCRRVLVNAPSGKLVDIEVIPADGQEYVGVSAGLYWGYNFPNRVTVSGGSEVWIFVRQLGRVTVVAAER